MSSAVASSSTFQRLATTRVAPAYMKPRTIPTMPSPRTGWPSAVLQALSTTSSTGSRSV